MKLGRALIYAGALWMLTAGVALNFPAPARAAEIARTTPVRGVLEGFYGTPWTWDQRESFVAWMSEAGFNLFVIAPKDEPLQRGDWRAPLPGDYVARLSKLVSVGRRRGVRVGWSLSPVDARLTDGDVAAATAKLRQAMTAGVSVFSLAFDDTDPDPAQITFANEVLRALKPGPDIELAFVPALYWGDAMDSGYLRDVAHRLDQRFAVGWTGPQILSRTITVEQAEVFRREMNHRLILGDNYPVQDRLVDSGPLYLGPLRGLEAGVPAKHVAVLFNASPLPEASKLPLWTAARFLADPARYDPWQAWEDGIRRLGGSRARWLRVLALECSASWLGGPAPGSLQDAVDDFWKTHDSRALRERLAEASSIRDRWPGLENRPLSKELEPWVMKLHYQAEDALFALDALERRPILATDVSLFESLRQHHEPNGAEVSNFALDRLLDRLGRELRGESISQAPLSLPELMRGCANGAQANCGFITPSLEAMADAPSALRRALGRGAEPALELVPWIGLLAEAASQGNAGERLPKWRARWRLLPLLASKELLDRFFDDSQAAWDGRSVPRHAEPWWLRLYLDVFRSSFPARLRRGIEAYRKDGNDVELRRTFEWMSGLHARLLSSHVELAAELSPWIDRVGEYGDAGLWLLNQKGKAPDPAHRPDWTRIRVSLRSLNGMERCPELRFWADAAGRWSRLPADLRSKPPDVIYNPLEPL